MIKQVLLLVVLGSMSIAHMLHAQNNPYSQNNVNQKKSAPIPDHYIEVRKLDDGRFFIEYAGSPSKTIEEARVEWHAKAKETCHGKDYEYNLWKDSMWQGDLKPAKSIYKGGGTAGATGAACATGGAIGCMIASLFDGFGGNKNLDKDTRFPVVEGSVSCK